MLNDVLKSAKEESSKRANIKTEVSVMQAMLNDRDFKVGVYKKNQGKVDDMSIYETSRELVSNILVNAANLSKNESDTLSHNYEFNKQAASNMVDISKEFFNTYLPTGKKIHLGSREDTNITLSMKHIESKEKVLQPNTLGNQTNEPITKTMPAYNTLKVSGKNLY